MRLTTFVPTFAMFVFILLLITPAVSAHFDEIPGPVPSRPTSKICIALSYPDAILDDVPHMVALLPNFVGTHIGYRARGDDLAWLDGFWTFAGPDSVDVTAHHRATLRIPLARKPGIGRGVLYRDGPLLWAFLYIRPPFSVITTPIPCSRLDRAWMRLGIQSNALVPPARHR